MQNAKTFNAIAISVMIALGTACATSGKGIQVKPEQEELARLQALPTNTAINEAEGYISQSKENNLDFLTPQHYDLAKQAIDEAKTLLSQNQPRQHVVQKVAVAEAMIKDGERVARHIKAELADELSIKGSLDKLNADEIYGSEYGSVIARLNQIIRQVEEGKKAESIDERQHLLAEMSNLERKSIKYNALKEPKEILKRVKYRGGSELAPQTYNEALEVYSRAESFINQNPHMRSAVEQLSQEALFAAKRALYVVEEVAALSHKVSMSLEQIVLDEEYRLARVAKALSVRDVRDNPLEVQSEILANYVEELSTQQKRQEDLVIALRDTLIKVRDASTPAAINATIRKLKKENSELLAKDALYSAKVSQLNAELEAKDSKLALVNNKLTQTEKALVMSEMESQALSMTVQQQKQAGYKDSQNELAEDVQLSLEEDQVRGEAQAKTDSVVEPELDTRIEKAQLENDSVAPANTDEQAIDTQRDTADAETDLEKVIETTALEQARKEIAAAPVDKPIVDKPTAAIIADISAQAEEPVTQTEQQMPEALASGN